MFVPSGTWLIATSLLYTVTSATPTRFTKKSQYPENRSHDPLLKRQNVAQPPEGFNNLPECEKDPSYATAESQFQDGAGVQVKSGDCDNGQDEHCWTDTFVVYWQHYLEDYKRVDEIDCRGTSSCSQQNERTNETCTQVKITSEEQYTAEFGANLQQWFGSDYSPTFKLQSKDTTDSLYSSNICLQDSTVGTCVWDDERCHGVWTARRVFRIWGYQRRSCDNPRDGLPMVSSRRIDGYWTVGMQDFSIDLPDQTHVGCAAPCGAPNYRANNVEDVTKKCFATGDQCQYGS